MAKKKDNEMDFDRPDNTYEVASTVAGTAAVKQPDPLDLKAAIDPKTLLAKVFGLDPDDVNALLKAKEEANAFAMAAQAESYAQDARSRMENEHIRRWVGLSAQERTQEVVNKAYKADETSQVYRCRLVKSPDGKGKPESITLDIPAHSAEEAQGRYLIVCGIRSTDHLVQVVPLSANNAQVEGDE